MVEKAVENVDIDYCKRCGGVWLDEGELEALSGLDPLTGRRLKCSKCNTVMITNIVQGVEIDVCQVCKTVWLDRGELEKLSGIDPRTGRKNILYEYIENELMTQLKDSD
jgi:Zn-finger nucleic acid-binding protein